MESPAQPVLTNSFLLEPEETPRIRTGHRSISTRLPVPESLDRLRAAARTFPQVNCYQPPVLWERAEGYRIFDAWGNIWIDFSSTAVATNTGHAHPKVRAAIARHVDGGLLAQFSFASDIRIRLAETLIQLAPPHCDKVYFWTVGSEAIEAAFRIARKWGTAQDVNKFHLLTLIDNFHGWTLAAHQLSGSSASKPWLGSSDQAIHHLPFPRLDAMREPSADSAEWDKQFERTLGHLAERGIEARQVAAVFVETLQGWGAIRLPQPFVERLRRWADEHQVLLVFDEIQTGFGRTGRWFGHEHYGVRADLICIGKGVTSSLPLAAVLGPAELLDVLDPAEVTTTHAAHPLSCAAALANIEVLKEEQLVEHAARKGEIADSHLEKLRHRFPKHVSWISGLGLLRAIHVQDPSTGASSRELARDWTWAAVKHGVMLFQVNRPTLKVCPPLIIPDDALVEGIEALGDALQSIL